ncbi:MAG: CoA-binding protein [Dehalococcoidia bacterium]|nr:CoA-binding protein [Dehalococcoidia bacterium]
MSAHPLDPIFHPRAIALVGVPSGEANVAQGFFTSLLEHHFERDHGLYPVNPKAQEIRGVRCYPTLLDTPDPVDHVISLVPARAVPVLVEQAIEKGVRSVHFFTAGFSETGDEEMAALEREMVSRLNEAGIRVFGPNCMGLYVPSEQIAFMAGFPPEPGNVMFVSQSGANASDVIRNLGARGVRFSKVISFGNGADLRAHHFLDYAAHDPETEVVTAYIEGVQDGRLFFEAVRRAAAEKPVILLKGGLTGAGARAAHSHTGSLAGSTQIFDALCRQAGAWRAETMDDLHDVTIAATTRLRDVQGRGVGLVGGGGGIAVLSADALAAAGLEVPPTPEETKRQLHEFIPIAGTSVNNPIDTNMGNAEAMERTLGIVARAENIDLVVTNPPLGRVGPAGAERPPDAERDREEAEAAVERIARLQEETGVPFVVLVRGAASPQMEHFAQEAYRRGIAVYPSIHRAARAIAAILAWRERREGLPAVV